MSRVEINAGGRQIVVDHEGELAHLADTAHALWLKTEVAQPSPGPAVGFTSTTRWTPEVPATGNGSRRPPAPVTAQESA